MTRVFVSHASADASFAEKFTNDLRAFGVDAWLDSSHMGPGDFVARINAALERDVLLLVLTPAALASPWVQQEMNAAITRANQKLMRSPIIIQAEFCPPEHIPALWTVYHRYDAMSNYMAALASIVKELGATGGEPLTPVTMSHWYEQSQHLQPASQKERGGWRPRYPGLAFIPLAGYALGGAALLFAVEVLGLGSNFSGNLVFLGGLSLLVVPLLIALILSIRFALIAGSRLWAIILGASVLLAVVGLAAPVLGSLPALAVLTFGLFGPRPGSAR
jgi:hypothetical protein